MNQIHQAHDRTVLRASMQITVGKMARARALKFLVAADDT